MRFNKIVKCATWDVVVISTYTRSRARQKTLVPFCGNISFKGTIQALFSNNNIASYIPSTTNNGGNQPQRNDKQPYNPSQEKSLDTLAEWSN